MQIRGHSSVLSSCALLIGALVVSCVSSRDAAFRREVDSVISEAIGLREKLAFNGTNYSAEDLKESTSGADGIIGRYIEHATALPQPNAGDLRYLRIRLLRHAEICRERHYDFAFYLASYTNPGAVSGEQRIQRLQVMQESEEALVQSTRLLGASERVALGTSAVNDWIDAVGSKDWYGSPDEEVSESDSAVAYEAHVRREIKVLR